MAKQAADNVEFKARGISRHVRKYFIMAQNGTQIHQENVIIVNYRSD